MNLTTTSSSIYVNNNHRYLPFPISFFLLLNLTLSNIRPIDNEIIDQQQQQNKYDSTDVIKRSAPREEINDDYMHSQLFKDFEMKLYQNQQQQQQQQINNNYDNQYQQQQTPFSLSSTIQQRQFNGMQSGYQGEGGGAGRLPFANSLYPYLGSKFLSLFPRKSFQLNPYNPFPFLPNLLPHLSYMPYTSQSYSNPWSWGTNPYFSPSFLNHYNSFSSFNNRFNAHQPEMVPAASSPTTNGAYRDYSTS